VDPDIIYAAVKAMHEGFDIYKGMHRAMPAWNINGAVRDPSPVPYHDDIIKRPAFGPRKWTNGRLNS
jgi:TRAP-type uncharacterized transport system substrate-binding protein